MVKGHCGQQDCSWNVAASCPDGIGSRGQAIQLHRLPPVSHFLQRMTGCPITTGVGVK